MGYMGKYVEVDLFRNKVKEASIDLNLGRKFIGGKGLGAKILYDLLEPDIDPLSSENPLIFMTGPLSGTAVQTSGRWCIVTKSPQTGTYLDSHIGGKFGHRLKKAGYDYVIIEGKAENPCYLEISDENIDIHSANDLWGKGNFKTEELLRKKYPKYEVSSIGPAGEKLVLFASITTGRTHIAGRGGVGAVMGSKNLKAVVTGGSEKIQAVHSEEFKKLTSEFAKKVKANPGVKRRREIGTVMWVKMANEAGFLPTRNYQSGVFEGAEAISGERMRDEFVIGNTTCYRCAIACGKTTRFTEGKYAELVVDGPEYETSALLGSNCGIDDLGAIAKSSELCDDLGLDTMTAGGTLSFAMECVEKGILSQSEIENLKFGNAEIIHELLNKIAYRKGIGDLLALGSLKIAEKLGKNTKDFAIQVKGLELAGVDPRGSFGMALAYSTADRGGCHQRCWTPTAELSGVIPRFSFEGIPKYVKESQDERAACYSLVLCDFLPFDISEMVSILNAATGFSYDEKTYLEAGERIWNLTRMFNNREGMTAENDVLPGRFYNDPSPEGDPKGLKISKEGFEKAKNEYYTVRGWDENGFPTKSKIKSLNL